MGIAGAALRAGTYTIAAHPRAVAGLIARGLGWREGQVGECGTEQQVLTVLALKARKSGEILCQADQQGA